MTKSEKKSMRVTSLFSEGLRLKRGQKIAPRMAIVHLTNRCNHKCSGCEYAGVHTPSPTEMEPETVLRVIDELADLGATSILFSGGGEPMMHPSFGKALGQASSRNLHIGIFSNGTVITPALADTIAGTATFIRVSVDAATAKTYARIRQVNPAYFEKLMVAIGYLMQAKEQGRSALEVGLKFLVRPCNMEEIMPFVELARELGVGSVQFKPVRNTHEVMNPDQSKVAQQYIEQAAKAYPEMRVQGGVSGEITVETPCWLTPLRVVISADGCVHLCNYFNHRRSTHTYGSIHENSLKDIWYGPRHRECLTTIKPGECTFYDCRFHKLNQELSDLVENHSASLYFI